MKTVTFKIDDSLSARVEAAAKERSMSKSDLLRLALELYLGGEAKPFPGSFLELAKDFVGCAEGPEDLSTNPDYLEGFGK
jgi:hypothetical protein